MKNTNRSTDATFKEIAEPSAAKASGNVATIAVPVCLCFLAALLLFVVLAVTGCAGSSEGQSSASASNEAADAQASSKQSEDLMSGKHHAVLEVEGYDPITIELDADAAPITVTNFADLVNKGYYDGLTFYRIVDDFCLQGGTKGNNAAGNDASLEAIQGEFAENGVDNALADRFEKGTVAMARTNDPDSATSTFFITLGDNDQVGLSLDGKYAAFGMIDAEGMATIDRLVQDYISNVSDPSMGAIEDEAKQPKIVSIQMVD